MFALHHLQPHVIPHPVSCLKHPVLIHMDVGVFVHTAKKVTGLWKVGADLQMCTYNLALQVYGKGAQLILPVPAFVVKTQNTADGQKVFINVCTSEKVSVGVRETKGGVQEEIVAGAGTGLERAGRSNRQGQGARGGHERTESQAH